MIVTATILLLTWTAQGTGSQVNTTSGLPHNCQDLIQQGKTYEGHYVVYPQASAAPNKPTMIYCSQDDGMEPMTSDKKVARNCLDLLQDGMTESGPSIIYPYLENPTDPVIVFCFQETDGGGWAVIQKRFDGSVDFYRNWADYAEGFGDVSLEHYLGNNHIAALTGQCIYELRVDLEAWDGNTAYAHYQMFHVGTAKYNYKMQVALYDGTAGDSFYVQGGHDFTTYDKDHDTSISNINCAEVYHGAWWYNSCMFSNLNGRYYHDASYASEGIRWNTFDDDRSLKSTNMMVRPTSCSTTHTDGHHDTQKAAGH